MSELQIPLPDDFHVHLRQGEILKAVVRETGRYFGRVLVMPNILPPVTTAERLQAYMQELEAARPSFMPIYTFQVTPNLDSRSIVNFKEQGAAAGKLYFEGATTNSVEGIRRIDDVYRVLASMEREDLVLSIHAEDTSFEILEREKRFIPILEGIRNRFPKLRIVVEHVSCAEMVEYILRAPPRTAATVTVHHLLYTLDDLLGNGLDPHLYCKPVVKTRVDRACIRSAVFNGNPRFFFGSDSAPHSVSIKECRRCAAGVFSAPAAIPLLAELFELNERIDRLADFTGRFGADFYGLPIPEKRITLWKESVRVPDSIAGCRPLKAGETVGWSLKPASGDLLL